jgi:hypothetical protein
MLRQLESSGVQNLRKARAPATSERKLVSVMPDPAVMMPVAEASSGRLGAPFGPTTVIAIGTHHHCSQPLPPHSVLCLTYSHLSDDLTGMLLCAGSVETLKPSFRIRYLHSGADADCCRFLLRPTLSQGPPGAGQVTREGVACEVAAADATAPARSPGSNCGAVVSTLPLRTAPPTNRLLPRAATPCQAVSSEERLLRTCRSICRWCKH